MTYTNNFFHLYLGILHIGTILSSNLVRTFVPSPNIFDATHYRTWDYLWDTVRSSSFHSQAAVYNLLHSCNFIIKLISFVSLIRYLVNVLPFVILEKFTTDIPQCINVRVVQQHTLGDWQQFIIPFLIFPLKCKWYNDRVWKLQ